MKVNFQFCNKDFTFSSFLVSKTTLWLIIASYLYFKDNRQRKQSYNKQLHHTNTVSIKQEKPTMIVEWVNIV